MAIEIKTRSAEILSEIISQHYRAKRLCVVSHSTIQEKAIVSLLDNIERYALRKTPVNIYNGVAERELLYPNLSYIMDYFLFPEEEYKPGSIARAMSDRGRDLTKTSKALSLANTKSAINFATDIALGMFISGSGDSKPDFNTVTKDFLWNMLNNKKFRMSTLERLLNNYSIPHYKDIDETAVNQIIAMITLGKGEVISPDFYHLHQAMRSIILMGVRKMVDLAIEKSQFEIFTDVLAVLSLFIIYVNVTENDSVYDKAFAAVTANGNNPIVHAKRLQGVKNLAMIYSKVGFSGKAFSGVLTTSLIAEMLKIFPDVLNSEAYYASETDSEGNPTVNMSAISFIQESSIRFNAAKEVFDDILPSMFKGYIEKIIQQIKDQTGADTILPTIFDDLEGTDQNSNAKSGIFPDLSASYMGNMEGIGGLQVILGSPDEADQLPPKALVEIGMRDIQKFLLSHVFPMISTTHEASVSLASEYKTVFQSLGTPTTGLIQGVNVELEMLDEHIFSNVPSIADATSFKYARISERYLYPTVFPAFVLDRDKLTQEWSLGHLKYNFFRPDLLALKYARDGVIANLPPHLKLEHFGAIEAHQRWSWLPSSLPIPTFVQNTAFAFTPLPFNYTADSVFDRMANSGDKIDVFMTRTGRIPSLGYMKFGEALSEYVTSGAVSPNDIALSLAGLGFLYVKDDKGYWNLIDPRCPTIYGMPTIIFRDMNEINVKSTLKEVNGILFPTAPDDPDSDGSRIIYDRSNRVMGVGSVILVLHKYIPASRSLRYMIQTLRSGFVVRVPFLASIYNKLFEVALKTVKAEYDGFKAVVDPETGSTNNYVAMNAAFNRMLTVFQTMPQGNTKDNITAADYYNQFLSDGKTTYKKFKDYHFEKVLGWSHVIVGYPHLTPTDRFVDHYPDHFNSWLRAYTSQIYVDASNMANFERMKVLSVTPNIIQQINYDDEVEFFTKKVDALVIDTLVESSVKPVSRENTTVADEAVVGPGMKKTESSNESKELIMGDIPENPPADFIPKSNVADTLRSLHEEEEIEPGKAIPKYKRTPTKGSAEVNIDDNNVTIEQEQKTVKDIVTTKKQIDSEGNEVSGTDDPELMAKNVSLDSGQTEANKGITRTDLGKGDIDDKDKEKEEEEAKKKKKKKSSDNDSDKEENLKD